MIEAEVADFWGHNVVRWNGAALRRAGVSDADASFLDRVGMPRNVNWTLDFASAAQEVRTLPGHASMVVIGGDDQNPICLRVSDGNVVCVEDKLLKRVQPGCGLRRSHGRLPVVAPASQQGQQDQCR